MIVTMDGLAGTGKGTIARIFAQRHNFTHLDCGLVYRGFSHLVVNEGVAIEELESTTISYGWDGSKASLLFKRKVLENLELPEFGELASSLCAKDRTTGFFNSALRVLAKPHQKLIADGRNTGSTIFPAADIKFFLNCDISIRAQRKSAQAAGMGKVVSVEETLSQLRQRDHRDMTRATDPMIVPEGAFILDTSKLEPAQCVELVSEIVMAN